MVLVQNQRLNGYESRRTQSSIQKVVSYALKHFKACGDVIWDCIIEVMQEGSINSRINILYFLDSLCEISLLSESHRRPDKNSNASGLYVQFVSRDLNRIVEIVVPNGRKGLPNLVSTKQILHNWRSKRYIEPQKIDEAMTLLNERAKYEPRSSGGDANDVSAPPSPHQSLSRGQINKRIEQDRERHKRLREKRWVQPMARNPAFFQTPRLASFYPLNDHEEQTLDIEFENDWETTSDWNPDDEEAIREETKLAFFADEGAT
ncbi:hypothetical protein CVT24_009670 [Panaeolus cyanescens]|uniref:CID domain-containing protein n=1 Tax=Panaeolus cyanescens TaxID=181874 RepID=A0A409Y9U3_9AGAR|nr:hypothetical protein CVT24_009670 [Panaeolus cyanescens]